MYKKSLLPIIIFISVAIGFTVGKFLYQSENIFYAQNNDFVKLKNLIELIEKNYENKINVFDYLHESLLRKLTEIDPYSYYLDEDKLEAYEMENEGLFYGLGISYLTLHDTITILDVYENSPAEEAGLKPLDQIIAIDNSKVIGIRSDSIASIFKTSKKFDLQVKSYFSDENRIVTVKKKDIELKSVFYTKLKNNIGYIKIDNFSFNTYDFFKEAAENFNNDNLEYLILDLRDNPGGILTTSVEILDELISSTDTLIVTKSNEDEEQVYYANKGGLLTESKLIVLVNSGSASASELLSVAIQDYDRGLFIGTRTYGKGVFQQNVKTVKNDFLHITTGKYFGPSGRWIDNRNYFEEINVEFFKTKHGRYVTSRSGIIPEVYYDYFNMKDIVRLVENYILDIIIENKSAFQNPTLENLENMSKTIADTSKYFSFGEDYSETITLSLMKYFSDDNTYQKRLINSDSTVIKAIEIIDQDLLEDKIFEYDTVKIRFPDMYN